MKRAYWHKYGKFCYILFLCFFISPTISYHRRLINIDVSIYTRVDFERAIWLSATNTYAPHSKINRSGFAVIFFFFKFLLRTIERIQIYGAFINSEKKKQNKGEEKKHAHERNSESKSLCLSYNHKNYIIESIKWIDGRATTTIRLGRYGNGHDVRFGLFFFLTRSCAHTRHYYGSIYDCMRRIIGWYFHWY